jgi:hypothetical protein
VGHLLGRRALAVLARRLHDTPTTKGHDGRILTSALLEHGAGSRSWVR